MEKQNQCSTLGFPYYTWEAELTQTLGMHKFPMFSINPANAAVYVDRFLKAPASWRKAYLKSSFNEKSFRAAVIKLFDDWHGEPGKAIQAVQARFAWMDAIYDNDATVKVVFDGHTFEINATKLKLEVHFNMKDGVEEENDDSIAYYLHDGVVGIPSAMALAALAAYIESKKGE